MTGPEYQTGQWTALVADGALALLHPGVSDDVARELWQLTTEGKRLGAWVEYLAAAGIAALPSFAMVEAHPEGLRVLVRGEVDVELDGQVVSGRGFATWREEVLPAVSDLTIRAQDGDGGWLPVTGGIVRAAAARLVAHRQAPAVAPSSVAEEADDVELTVARMPALAAAIGVPAGAGDVDLDATQAPSSDTAVDIEVTRDPEPEDEPAAVAAAEPVEPGGIIDSVPGRPRPAPPDVPAGPPAGQPAGQPAGPLAGPPTDVPAPGATPLMNPFDEDGDHDGQTILTSELPITSTPTAMGSAEPPPDPGVELVLSTGTRIEMDRPVLLGRAPEAARFAGTEVPRLVSVANPERDVSATHVEVRPAGGHVVVTDMSSTNGTVVHLPDQPAFRLQPGTGVPVGDGAVIELGTGVTVTVEHLGAAQ